MPLFRRSSQQAQSQDQHQHQNIAPVRPSPLDIPELLETIFLFSSRHGLLKYISLVCRQWYNVAKKCISITGSLKWVIADEQPVNNLGQMVQSLHGVRALEFHHDDFYIAICLFEKFEKAFHDIGTSLDGMVKGGQFKVKDLIINFPVKYDTLVFPLLDIAGPFLTTLELSELWLLEVPLQGILARCPKLFNLKLKSCSHSSSRHLMLDHQDIPNHLLLRSLHLASVSVKSTNLMQALRSSPNMEELQLIQIMSVDDSVSEPESTTSKFTSVLETSFVREVARLCPRLKKVHLSNNPSTSIPRPSYEAINSLLSAFPHVVNWGFLGFDLCSPTRFESLKVRTNTITSLEMVGRIEFVDNDTNCFHEFLCDSPQLIHLKAPEVLFSTLFLDLEGVVDWVKWNPKHAFETQRSIKPYHRKIWACRNLRTLHMSFIHSNSKYSTPEARSRLVFGYISRVCPRLQDLVLFQEELDLKLNGGFCLLTRLQELESLKISSPWKGKNRHTSEVDWIPREMSQALRIRMSLWITMNNLMESKTFYATSPFQISTNACNPFLLEGLVDTAADDSCTDDHMIDGVDMRYLGRLKDITMCFQDRLSSNMLCWPHMETITLANMPRYYKKSRRATKHIKSHRPDIIVK